eukprot:jgi/Tetstr1/421928/TSEL_012827.t1
MASFSSGPSSGPSPVSFRRPSMDDAPLTLLLARARGLPVKNLMDGTSDPYCAFSLAPSEEYRPDAAILEAWTFTSRACNRTLTPQWYEEVVVPTCQGSQVLQIEMHDKQFWTSKLPNVLGLDRFHHIGTARIPLKDITYTPTWFPLRDLGGKPAGEVEVNRVVEGGVNVMLHPYRKYFSKAASMLQGKLGGVYTVYEVDLHHVDDIFKGSRAGWNREYRAAQMIFGDTPDAYAIRAAVQGQHQWLYNNIPSPETGAISGGSQLLQLFGFGKRTGKRRSYTYVVVEAPQEQKYLISGSRYLFRFSETGIKLAKDYLSKHAMHAGGAEEVVFAGEFHVKDEGGEYTLLLDNNSGTYAPSNEMLPALATVFLRNFEDLKVLALDRESPELKEIVAQLKPITSSTAPLPASLANAVPEPIPDAI